MDKDTLRILKRIDFHIKVKKILTFSSYFLIISGILIFVFYALNQPHQKYKLVSDYQKDPENFKSEKIMINPKTRFQYNDQQIYEIQAKKASHKNNEEVTLFDVYAVGKIGKITSGKLQIEENGNHLIFSQNPVLILNNQKK
jgi:hypothetical protein